MGNCTNRDHYKDTFHQSNFNSVGPFQNIEKLDLIQNNNTDTISLLQKELFNAKSTSDIQTIISFMQSDLELKQPIVLNHTWAKTLNTIGSIASFYLALLFSSELIVEEEQQTQINLYSKLRESKANIIIAQNLESQMKDRQQITLLLLFNLVENDSYINDLNQTNIFDNLLKFLNLQVNYDSEQRTTALFILKRLYKNNQFLIIKFLQCQQSIECLKFFLQFAIYQHIQEGINLNIIFQNFKLFSALSSLDDLFMDQNNEINFVNCNLLKDYGFLEILKDLRQKINDKLKTQNEDSFQEYLDLNLKLTTVLIKKLND